MSIQFPLIFTTVYNILQRFTEYLYFCIFTVLNPKLHNFGVWLWENGCLTFSTQTFKHPLFNLHNFALQLCSTVFNYGTFIYEQYNHLVYQIGEIPMKRKDNTTRIALSKECRTALQEVGHKGETYEDILWRLMGKKKPEKKKSVWKSD